ncbi:MAG: hypothetical protein B7Y43_01210 [Sphingomonas sp. 28-62-20]|nr:MAG: hypothetical protein B7Y43_01210 [Sphingomonas sp. 28-62-20]
MRSFSVSCPLAAALFVAASPVSAQLHSLVEPPASAAAALDRGVDVFLVNEGRSAQPVAAPETIDTVAADGTALTLSLVRSTADTAPVPPGGFVKLRYRLAPRRPAPVREAVTLAGAETIVDDARGPSSGFFDRFRPYEPTYAVAGAGNAGAKLQFSFAARPIAGGIGAHLNVAYTQTIFWSILQRSGPIRTNTYSPEVFFDLPISRSSTAAFGYRHDSNGGGPRDSVDLNRIFVRANARFDLGDGWQLDIAPQSWVFVGNHGIATDLERFWGYGSVNASIGQRDGLKLALMARGNPGTGMGAGELLVSYPLRRFGAGDVGLYLFGQAFTGYGEALPDYNRQSTNVRLGISFTR